MKYLLTLSLLSFLLTQCNSVKVTGNVPNPPLTNLIIVNNDDVHMSGFQPELVKQVAAMGITPQVVDAPPAGDVPYLTYKANWSWDFAMYLSYFKADLHQGSSVLRSAQYRTSGLDLNKFGPTAEKLRPVLRDLLRGEKAAAR